MTHVTQSHPATKNCRCNVVCVTMTSDRSPTYRRYPTPDCPVHSLWGLLEEYKNGRTVRHALYDRSTGTIEGTGLGGATKRGGLRPHLNCRVRWADGSESVEWHNTLEVIR